MHACQKVRAESLPKPYDLPPPCVTGGDDRMWEGYDRMLIKSGSRKIPPSRFFFFFLRGEASWLEFGSCGDKNGGGDNREFSVEKQGQLLYFGAGGGGRRQRGAVRRCFFDERQKLYTDEGQILKK